MRQCIYGLTNPIIKEYMDVEEIVEYINNVNNPALKEPFPTHIYPDMTDSQRIKLKTYFPQLTFV